MARKEHILGIRFTRVGKLYHYDSTAYPSAQPGDYVVVDTKRGMQMAEVVKIVKDEPRPRSGYKAIEHVATPRELVMMQAWQAKELGVLIRCRELASKQKLADLKWVKAEYNYDGSVLTFFFSMDENLEEPRHPLNQLKTALTAEYPDTEMYLQRIGPRDVAKLLGGYGACGSPRCCSTFLTEFSPVSIKMAKDQGLSLAPEEITGMCGRLRCCLVYEYEQYVEARKHLPRRNKRIGTPKGEGKVLDVFPLKDSVLVLVDEATFIFQREELEPLEEFEALQKKAAAGCAKHEGGECDCGKKQGAVADESNDTNEEAFPLSSRELDFGDLLE
ncbi:MAG TPA: regulatory iron-sulfur-containing complex subunit RicT [Anaerolineales bacterium]|nr:regulatory iron-sulfur-containing complex subunit RicT [Anaerolineales bacterium]